MSEPRVLIVDDDEVALLTLQKVLLKNGFLSITAINGRNALEVLERNEVEVVVADLMMPVMGGLELLKEIKQRYRNLPFIILTGHGTLGTAVASMKEGASDYLLKPFEPEVMIATIRRTVDYNRLNEENVKLRTQLTRQHSFQNIVTRSPVMRAALENAEKVANTPNTSVALYGESGTGKEVLARAVHFAGPRMANNFVAVNCAGIPSSLLESELFGHVKGAFTGADRDREGRLDFAQKGTILFDEIGDMSLDLQAKLLRVLQEKVYERVGSHKPVKADVRIIVATHRNLEEMTRAGAFRADLYHRINSFPITIPPLRERSEDIPLLVDHFLALLRAELGKPLPGISPKGMTKLLGYSWPGNIRELKNCIERAAILTGDQLIEPHHLIIGDSEHSADAGGKKNRPGIIRFECGLPEKEFTMENITSEALKFALARFDGNKSKAADFLKVDRSIFYRRT